MDEDMFSQAIYISYTDISFMHVCCRDILAKAPNFKKMLTAGGFIIPGLVVAGTILVDRFVNSAVEFIALLISDKSEVCNLNQSFLRLFVNRRPDSSRANGLSRPQSKAHDGVIRR